MGSSKSNGSLEIVSKVKDVFLSVIKKQLAPSELDKTIENLYSKILTEAVENCDDKVTALKIVAGFKKIIQENERCNDIANSALQFISETAKPENVEKDWLNAFFDKARLIESDDLKLLWSKVLAEEFNEPGSVSLSLLHTLSMLRKNQAQSFCNLVRFCFREYKKDVYHPLIFVTKNPGAYKDSNIDFKTLKELEQLGLIYCSFTDEFTFSRKKVFAVGNHIVEVYGDENNDNRILAGNVIFTEDGKKLFEMVNNELKKYRRDIFEFTFEQFEKRNCKILVNGSEFGRM